MTDKEITLIENQFKAYLKDEGIYIESLLLDNMEILAYNSIKRYSENPIVYNFLIEIKNLIQEGKAELKNDLLFISYNTISNLDTTEQDILLCLPERKDFNLVIKDRGLIGSEKFTFEYKIIDENGEELSLDIVGCFAFQGKKPYLLNPYQYEILRIINHINSLHPQDKEELEDKDLEIWKSINQFKEFEKYPEQIRLTLSSLFNKEKVLIPSKMSFKINADKYENFDLQPILCGLSEEEENLFSEKYKDLSSVSSNYVVRNNTGEKVRIIISPEIKDNLKTIKDTPTIRRKKDKQLIMNNPYAIFKHPELVSLEDFSSKVVDFGLYKKIDFFENTQSIEWAFPKQYLVKDISGQNTEICILNKDMFAEVSDIVTEAYNSEESYFNFENRLIPFTENNLYEIKELIRVSKPEDDDDKLPKGKTIHLRDRENKLHDIILTRDLVEELRDQVQSLRNMLKVNNSYKTEPLLEINEILFPMSIENIKQMKEIVEIHLLESDNEEFAKAYEEVLYNAYCNLKEELPKDLKNEIKLKNHQKIGLAWLENSYKMKEVGRTGVLLADDMGLGKTLQILSFIFWLNEKYKQNLNGKPILIVAPVILLQNWVDEYNKFFNTNSDIGQPLVLHSDNIKKLRLNASGDFLGKEFYQITKDSSAPKSYLDVDEIKKHRIIITNYETLANYEYSFGRIDWSLVILDEAQKIKNESSHQSQVACKLKSDFNIACTGTPIENSLIDLWTIFKFLQDDLLGAKRYFVEEFGDGDMDDKKYEQLQDKFFYKKPYAYILRRSKATELNDLPKKNIVITDVEMNNDFRNAYESLKQEMRLGGGAGTLYKINLLHQMPEILSDKLPQACNDNSKFNKLIEILRNIKEKNEKALIFCISIEVQAALKRKLEEEFNLENINIINGSSSNVKLRQEYIKEFSKDANSFNIMILSPIAAGTGLNITAANHVIHYGRWWNPAIEKQATDRVYRIGQKKEVYIHYLIYKDSKTKTPSFDEHLHHLIVGKNDRSDNFLIPNNINLESALLNSYK